jgi:hypothetical protein
MLEFRSKSIIKSIRSSGDPIKVLELMDRWSHFGVRMEASEEKVLDFLGAPLITHPE